MLVGILHTGKVYNDQEAENRRQSYYQTENVYVWYSDEAYTDFFTNAAVAFHEKNPDIRVIPTYIDSREYLENINSASIQGEKFPDIFVSANNSLEKAYLAGLASTVRDNDNVLNLNHFSQSALDAVSYKNNLIAYPLTFETTVLLYNKTYILDWIEKANEGNINYGEGVNPDEIDTDEFDQDELDNLEEAAAAAAADKVVYSLENTLPTTFDEIKTFSGVFEAPEGVEGVMKWDVSDIVFNYLFVGGYLNIGGNAGDDTDNISIYNEKTLECVEYYQGLSQFFSIEIDEADYNTVLDDFLEGKTVFTIVTSDAIAKVNGKTADMQAAIDEKIAEKDSYLFQAQEAERAEVDGTEYKEKAEAVEIPSMVEFGYMVIPDLTQELKSSSLSVTDALVINGYSEVKDAANKFAAFVTTEYSSNIYNRTGKLAASTDANYTDEAQLAFQNEYADSVPLPKMVELSNLWVQLEINFTEIWKGESAEDRLKALNDQMQSQIITTGE